MNQNYKACRFTDAQKFEDFHRSGLVFTLKNTGKHMNKDRDRQKHRLTDTHRYTQRDTSKNLEMVCLV